MGVKLLTCPISTYASLRFFKIACWKWAGKNRLEKFALFLGINGKICILNISNISTSNEPLLFHLQKCYLHMYKNNLHNSLKKCLSNKYGNNIIPLKTHRLKTNVHNNFTLNWQISKSSVHNQVIFNE